MDGIKTLMGSLLIITLFLGIGIGYLLLPQNESCGTEITNRCPAEITSLDALTVALHDPEVIGLLENKSIGTITFSRGTYTDKDMNYTQIVFHPQDVNPENHMTAPLIVVQINDSCMISAAYETYPSYIPEATPKTQDSPNKH